MADPGYFFDASFVYASLKTLLLIHFTLTFLTYVLCTVFGFRFGKNISTPSRDRPVLVVTAHPDDECMFFAPAILTLTAGTTYGRVHLLCVSNGDAYGKGKIREKEILKSCPILGIPVENITVVNDPHLQDGKDWRTELVEAHIYNKIEQIQPEMMLTFDSYGVSGNRNHIAVSKAVTNIFSKNNGRRPRGVRTVYVLESTSLWRKYIGVLDLPFTVLSSSHFVVRGPQDMIRGQKAMLAHKSQLEWYRLLYIVFSRYMLMNSFTPILVS